MTEAADFETLLRRALAPVEPPADLADRLETRLERITDLALDELESWEMEVMRDPRNWGRIARPAAAAVIGTGAGAALVLLRARRKARREAVPGVVRALRDATDALRR